MARINDERRNIIIHRFGIPMSIVMQRLQQMKENAFQEHTHLAGANVDWLPDEDARLKALSCQGSIHREQFYLKKGSRHREQFWRTSL